MDLVLVLTLKTRIVQYVNPYIPIVLLRPTKSRTLCTALSVIIRMKIMGRRAAVMAVVAAAVVGDDDGSDNDNDADDDEDTGGGDSIVLLIGNQRVEIEAVFVKTFLWRSDVSALSLPSIGSSPAPPVRLFRRIPSSEMMCLHDTTCLQWGWVKLLSFYFSCYPFGLQPSTLESAAICSVLCLHVCRRIS